MSKASFDKNFQNPLLRKLDQEARKAVQRQRGQLLILADTKDLEAVIKMVVPGIVLKQSDLRAALKAGQKHAKRLHESFKKRNTRRYNAVVAKLPSIGLPYKLEKTMFIVSSFSKSIDTIKRTMLNVLVEKGVFNEMQKAEVSRNLHKGHGARGTAVSQVQIARSVSALDDATKKLLLYNLEAAHSQGDLSSIQHREITKLITNSRQIVTKAGKLAADYVSVISFQTGTENIKDSEGEKALKKAYRDFISSITPELADMEGSSSLSQKAEKVIVDKFRGKQGIKVTGKTKSYKLQTSTKVETKRKPKKARVGITRGTPQKGKVSKGAASLPLHLIGIINKELPDTVRKNMEAPALENRTGRFADSVRLTDIIQTPKGYPSFGYTYARTPYEVFEVGSRGNWATPERDPRKLIDKSIREIAAQFAIGRFYTRRV